MKLKIIQDPEVKEVADVLNIIFEFDDWDLVFDDLPECGFVNDLTFQEMLNKVRPTIKKYAKTPMRCRYVEKRMKLFWNAYIDEVFPRKFKYDLRWAYAHQIVGAFEGLEIIQILTLVLNFMPHVYFMVYLVKIWKELRNTIENIVDVCTECVLAHPYEFIIN